MAVTQDGYDVFLSYSSADAVVVEAIAGRLREAGLAPFLDRWHLTPGMPWQEELPAALARSATAAVFIGESGVNPWHNEELRVALDRAVRSRDEFRVIPVLLPGADPAAVPDFLSQRTWVDFQPGADDPEALHRLVRGVRGEAIVEGAYELPDHPAPYRGLLRFETGDAALFFGRDGDVQRLVGKLETARFVAVVGASGSGKSSLVRAGLLPALADGAIAGSETWRALVLTPGSDPMRSLAEQVATLDPVADRLALVDALTERFADGPDGLRTAIGALTAEDRRPVVIVVDQFEELFTLAPGSSSSGRETAGRFVAALAESSGDPVGLCRVIITLRADFVDRALSVPGLLELIEDDQVLLGALSPEALREVIVRPAQAVGALLEKGLVRSILEDVDDEPGGLPLLQHALHELWVRRRGPWLTLDAYEESGGVAGALRHRAQATYEHLTPAQQDVARSVFMRLTTLGEGVQDTRRRVHRSELYPAGADAGEIDAVLQSLSDERSRLLVADQATVEVAHEALLQEWDTLRGWLDEDRQALRVHRRLTEAAREWIDLERDEGSLYRSAKLAEAEEWWATHDDQLTRDEEDFLHASRHRTHQELANERARAARLQRRLVAAIVALVLALGGVVAALWALDRANQAEAAAESAAAEARSRELAASSVAVRDRDTSLAALLAIESAETAGIAGGTTRASAFAALWGVALSPWRATLDHDDWVESVVFSPDGSLIATAGGDGMARVWDRDGGLVATLGHDDRVGSVVFSPDGSLIATAGDDGTARVWERDGGLVATLGHDDWVGSVVFSPDGSLIATASGDGTARVWDADDGGLVATLDHDVPVVSVMFSRHGSLIATSSDDGRARVWDGEGGLVATLVHDGPVWSVVFSPDGYLILTTAGDGGTARVWDRDGGLVATLGHDDWVEPVVFSPDGSLIATASSDGMARVWDREGGLLATLGHDGEVVSVVFSPDGSLIATASFDGTARVWDLEGGLLATLGHDGEVGSVVFSPDGSLIATASFDGTARVWDLEGGLLATLGHDDVVGSVVFSPDGSLIATASSDGTARVWDGDGGPVATLGHDDWVGSVVFSRDGSLIATASLDGTARVWDADDGGLVATLGHDDVVWSVVFSPDGSLIATASSDGTARVWDGDGGPVATLGHDDEVGSVVFSPDGSLIATASRDGTARVWDRDGALVATLGHDDVVGSVVFSPDGSLIATASRDGTARVWNRDGALVATLGHDDVVGSVVFSPDGSLIATASSDGTARVWDGEGGLVATLGHDDVVWSVVFSPDGSRIATVSEDRTARVWDGEGGLVVTLGHDDVVGSVVFNPDGSLIATASFDGTARVWDREGGLVATLGHDGGVLSAVFNPEGSLIATASDDGTARIWQVWTFDLVLEEIRDRAAGREFTASECQVYRIDPCPATAENGLPPPT